MRLVTVTFDLPDLTTVLAWIGAVAGVAALIWQVFTWRRLAHRVKVSSHLAWLGVAPGRHMGEKVVCIVVRNVGVAAVDITGWGITAEEGGNLFDLLPHARNPELPHRLEPGSQTSFYISEDGVRGHAEGNGYPLKKMHSWVELATGQKVRDRKQIPVKPSPR